MELALRADVSIAFINAIENKQKWVSAKTLSKITDALNTSPYELFLTDDIDKKDLRIMADRHSELIADLNSIVKKYTQDCPKENFTDNCSSL